MKRFLSSLLCLGLLALVYGCTQNSQIEETDDLASVFPINIGGKTAFLEIAATPKERADGLMFRESLEEDHGMLFIYKFPGRQGFWMRNTPLKLDLAHFDSTGILLETHTLLPHNEQTVNSIHDNVLVSVEMNYSWFVRNGIRPGARIDLEQLSDALIAKGLPIEAYPLRADD
ncbi:MAG: DUF192 domain-containing protein [Lentimonas sp.]